MIEIIFRLEQLDYLIRTSNTGSRKALAEKLNVSKRTISRWLDFMRERGAEIEFGRNKNSYFYKKPGNFIVKAEFIEKKNCCNSDAFFNVPIRRSMLRFSNLIY